MFNIDWRSSVKAAKYWEMKEIQFEIDFKIMTQKPSPQKWNPINIYLPPNVIFEIWDLIGTYLIGLVTKNIEL